MKNLFLVLSILAAPIFAFADDWDHDRDYDRGRGCYNSSEIAYHAEELARETRQLGRDRDGRDRDGRDRDGRDRDGRGPRPDRNFEILRRLRMAAEDLAQDASRNVSCRMLKGQFYDRVVPAFEALTDNRRPGWERWLPWEVVNNNGDFRELRRAFSELKQDIMEADDSDRGPRGPWRGPGRGPGNGGPGNGGPGNGGPGNGGPGNGGPGNGGPGNGGPGNGGPGNGGPGPRH